MVVYIFDVDGTLTPPRKPMDKNVIQYLEKFLVENPSYIVSGSNYEKIKEQIPKDILNLFKGVFSSMGNVYHIHDKLIYECTLTSNQELINDLDSFRSNTKYNGTLFDNYIEHRKGMINFSVLGRNCSYESRSDYNKWDREHKERDNICLNLQKKYPQYDFYVGGQISIDIMPKGKCKSQVITYLREQYTKELFIFIGDRIDKGGNDYTIALACYADKNAKVIGIDNHNNLINVLNCIDNNKKY